jgi:outer membrane protein TolC
VLSDLPGSSARTRSAEAKSLAIDAEREALEDRIANEIFEAYQAAREADVAVRTTARGLAAAEESYRVRRILYQNGKATTVELLDAETELTRARLETVNAKIDARVARIRLDYAVGRLGAGS